MSLNLDELRRKAKLGNRLAIKVLPLRRNPHLTLASILLTNVAAVSATSLFLGQHINGIIAGILSTLLIVIFGEVIPQALFSKNPLIWSNRFAGVLKLMIGITYIVSKPLQLLLDRLFPKQRVQLQTRHELGLIITEHLTDSTSELDEDEVEIMRGALSLSEKRVRDIMTKLKHTYYLTPEMLLDGPKIDEIKEKGFSRIPVFDTELSDCLGIILMKDLIDIDFDEQSRSLAEMTLHPTKTVGSMTALDTMFRKFISAKSHLIPVEKDGEIIGIVTIEDLLEEIIGHEIEDESDHQRRLNKLRAGV
ncbi:MAG: hypothetical protein NVS1B10_00610 [Candidatus Saccharimonadales bacterium]